MKKEFRQAEVKLETVREPFSPPYAEELNIGGGRKRTWRKISVSNRAGYIEIQGPYDVAQIYADGRLVADNFYFGMPWRVPAKLLYGKECYVVMSEIRDDFYREY